METNKGECVLYWAVYIFGAKCRKYMMFIEFSMSYIVVCELLEI